MQKQKIKPDQIISGTDFIRIAHLRALKIILISIDTQR